MNIDDAILAVENYCGMKICFDGKHYFLYSTDKNGEVFVSGCLLDSELIDYASIVLKKNNKKGFFSFMAFSVFFAVIVCLTLKIMDVIL